MKRIIINDEEIIIGTAREIKNLWKKLTDKGIAMPSHVGIPKFNMDRMYGLSMSSMNNPYGYTCIYILNSDTVLGLIYDFGGDIL